MFGDGDAELDLTGDLLANGKTSRLYRELVFTRRIALDVASYQSSRELSGFFLVVATAAPGHSLAELDDAIRAEIAAIARDGPTVEELERGRVQAEAQFLYRLQTVGGFSGKSDQLNAYNVFVGDPGYFDRDLQRYRDADRQAVQRAADRFLRGEPCVALSVVPRGRPELALAESSSVRPG
jgi:zinc protease